MKLYLSFLSCLLPLYSVSAQFVNEDTLNNSPERAIEILLNSTKWSDNIGPLHIYNGGWTGGNHYYDNISIKTAETLSFSFSADGNQIINDSIIEAGIVEIQVVNQLYDPRVPPQEGATILTSPLCKEYVTYTVRNGNIDVVVTHDFSGATPGIILTYYGMQSMFYDETSILTPHGKYANDWETTDSKLPEGFTKGECPDFNTFIEKRDDGYIQLTRLYPTGIGNHEKLKDNDLIFTRGSDKSYHYMLRGYYFDSSTQYTWHGLYSWNPDSIDATAFDIQCRNSQEKAFHKQIVKVTGDKLYIGYNYDDEKDLLITFEKSMNNNLMTFSNVGLSTHPKDGVQDIDSGCSQAAIEGYYDIHGRRSNTPRIGFNIVVYTDGSVRKLLIK